MTRLVVEIRRAALGSTLASLGLWANAAHAQVPQLAPPQSAIPVTVGVAPGDISTLPPEAYAEGPLIGEPFISSEPGECACSGCKGAMYRLGYKIGFCLRDNLIGYPQYFDEPALGRSLYDNMGRQKAKADVHTYTLYQSDFLAGTADLSPGGARRLSYLASRLNRWSGPVVIEWTPDQPPLAEARRMAVVASLQNARLVDNPARVVIGPAAFRGMIGPDAGNNHDTLIYRDYTAPRSFSVSPTSTAEFGGGAR